MVIGEGVAG